MAENGKSMKNFSLTQWALGGMAAVIIFLSGYAVKSDAPHQVLLKEITRVERELNDKLNNLANITTINTTNITAINSRFDRLELKIDQLILALGKK